MFTLDQINDIHHRLDKSGTLPAYLQALNAIGINYYDSYLSDGHSEYFGMGGEKLVSAPVHETFAIADKSDRKEFLRHLEMHGRGETSYLEMSRGLAASGIEKWRFDTEKMTIAYYDKAGNVLLTEAI